MKSFIRKAEVLVLAIVMTCGIAFASTTHRIIYDLDGGMITSEFVRYMDYTEVAELPTAEKENYVFEGWSDGSQIITRLHHISKTTHLQAVWTPKVYSVTFLDQGVEVSKTNYTYGEGLAELSIYSQAIQKNHPYEDFAGWSEDGSTVIDSLTSEDSGDKALVAVFKGKTYSISYELDEGTSENPDNYRYGEGLQLQDGQRDGYDFEGWYLNDEKVTEIGKEMHKDVTLVAKWTAKELPKSSYGSAGTSVSESKSSYGSARDVSNSAAALPDINYYVSRAIQDGGQEAIDAEDCGMYMVENFGYNGYYVLEDGSTISNDEYWDKPMDERANITTVEHVVHYITCYYDHAHQGLSRLPERISAGAKFYLNGKEYTYTGEWGTGLNSLAFDKQTKHNLVIITCTPDNSGRYFLYFD